jgi:hypothetical protein
MNNAMPVAEKLSHIDRMMSTSGIVDRALKEGVRQALVRHKKLGEAVAVSNGGKITIIPADQIEVSETPIES